MFLKILQSRYYVYFSINILNPPSHGSLNTVAYWLPAKEMDASIRVQILDELDCISHVTNTHGKGMNPIILRPAISK